MTLAQIPGSVLLDILAIVIVGYIALRQFREKRLRVSRLWILPALTLLFSYTGIQGDLFDTAFSPTIIGAAFVIGLGVGGLRGALTKLTVDAGSETVTVKGTFVSVALWLALLGVKGAADFILAASGKADSVRWRGRHAGDRRPAGVLAGRGDRHARLLLLALRALDHRDACSGEAASAGVRRWSGCIIAASRDRRGMEHSWPPERGSGAREPF